MMWIAPVVVVLLTLLLSVILSAIYKPHAIHRYFGWTAMSLLMVLSVVILTHQGVALRQLHHMPLANAHYLIYVFTLIILIMLLPGICLWRVHVVHGFSLLLALMLAAYGLTLDRQSTWISTGQSAPLDWVFVVHMLTVLISLAASFVSFTAAGVYFFEQQALKRKRLSWIHFGVPPLNVLDRLALQHLVLGFVAMTVALVSGVILAHTYAAQTWPMEPKFVFSSVTWSWFAFVLTVRVLLGWRGHYFLYLTGVGFVLLGFVFVASRMTGAL